MSASRYQEKGPPKSSVNEAHSDVPSDDLASGNVVDVTAGSQALHRKLRGKEVQLFAIGGAIGTCKEMQSTPS
jgi:yeast amino acid transporter